MLGNRHCLRQVFASTLNDFLRCHLNSSRPSVLGDFPTRFDGLLACQARTGTSFTVDYPFRTPSSNPSRFSRSHGSVAHVAVACLATGTLKWIRACPVSAGYIPSPCDLGQSPAEPFEVQPHSLLDDLKASCFLLRGLTIRSYRTN